METEWRQGCVGRVYCVSEQEREMTGVWAGTGTWPSFCRPPALPPGEMANGQDGEWGHLACRALCKAL